MGRYIKSPMNYVGGKYKILNDIIPDMPKNINKFVDLFCGGLNVGINVKSNVCYANDIDTYLINWYKYVSVTPFNVLLEQIQERIRQYGLSLTNSDGYNQLRADYNKTKQPIDFFLLVCYSFNHQIRFNSKHEFNMPFGKNRSCFNDRIKENLHEFSNALTTGRFEFSNMNFKDFDYSIFAKGDLVYCDPPYSITIAAYNDGKRGFGGWTKRDDIELLGILDNLNENGIWFALSNVLSSNGNNNELLINWSKKYNVRHINKTYSNCSYNLKDRSGNTDEVLITNY